MIPSKRLWIALALLTLLALTVSIWPAQRHLWLIAIAVVAGTALLDALLAFLPHGLAATREIPDSLPLGVWRHASLRLRNRKNRRNRLQVFDHFPNSLQVRGLPQTVTLAPRSFADIGYDLRPTERLELEFPATQIRLLSPLGLWWRQLRLKNTSKSRVYPNFAAVSKYILLALDNRLSQMGILKHRRRGEGQDFHQLREYRRGDSLRQVDWKASSRLRKIISREYQDERDQQVFFLIDCGHRMLSRDGELSHFDHTLNATLLLAYVALRQGDAVGLGTFGGAERWLPPVKGIGMLNRLLNQIYDLQPSTQSPDYSRAVMELLKRQSKRALVIVITNLRDEDSDDLMQALRLLRRRHLVLLASIREEILEKTLEKHVQDFDDAVRVAATHEYLRHRQATFDQIRAHNIISLDVAPSDLSVSLVNQYLDIKSSGKL